MAVHTRLPLLEDISPATAQCHAIDVLTHIHHLYYVTQRAGTHTIAHQENGLLLSRSHRHFSLGNLPTTDSCCLLSTQDSQIDIPLSYVPCLFSNKDNENWK